MATTETQPSRGSYGGPPVMLAAAVNNSVEITTEELIRQQE